MKVTVEIPDFMIYSNHGGEGDQTFLAHLKDEIISQVATEVIRSRALLLDQVKFEAQKMVEEKLSKMDKDIEALLDDIEKRVTRKINLLKADEPCSKDSTK